LDECFRNPYKNYYFETLLKAVNNELYEITGDDKGIKKHVNCLMILLLCEVMRVGQLN
jgi:hypothetical protein